METNIIVYRGAIGIMENGNYPSGFRIKGLGLGYKATWVGKTGNHPGCNGSYRVL